METTRQINESNARYPRHLAVDLQRIVEVLKRHGAQHVILYGSFARGDFREDSDFDLCVEGLSSRDFFVAVTDCLMATDRPVSLTDLKNVHGYLRERILNEGKVLYDARNIQTGNRFWVGKP